MSPTAPQMMRVGWMEGVGDWLTNVFKHSISGVCPHPLPLPLRAHCSCVVFPGLRQVAELKRQLGQRNFERDCLRGDVDDLKAKVRT